MTTSPVTGPGLRVENVSVERGRATVVEKVSLEVAPGEIVAILGANGAGKSSLLAAISGAIPTSGGRIEVDGLCIDAFPMERRAALVSHVPEGRRLFPHHNVEENLSLGAWATPPAERRERLEFVRSAFPELGPHRHRPAGSLSGGQQQMVALGRGMMAPGRILMIDELSLGLAPKIASGFAATLSRLRGEGYGILLVEQYVHLAMSVADRVIVLSRGRVVLAGEADKFRHDQTSLQDAYLGHEDPELTWVEGAAQRNAPSPALPEDHRVPTSMPLIAGLIGLLAATLMPWFSFIAFAGPGGTLNAFDLQPVWWAGPVAGSVMAALAAARPVLHHRAPSRAEAATAFAAALALVLIVASRVWLFAAGLPRPYERVYSRSWGLLIAVHAAGLTIIGALAMWRHATTERSEGHR